MESSHVLVHIVDGPHAGQQHWLARSRIGTVSYPEEDTFTEANAVVQYIGAYTVSELSVAETPEEVVGAPTQAIGRILLDIEEVTHALAMTDIGGVLVGKLLDARKVLERTYPGVVQPR